MSHHACGCISGLLLELLILLFLFRELNYLTNALQCMDFIFFTRSAGTVATHQKYILPFLCVHILPSPLLTCTPHLVTIFNLSSKKGGSSCSESYGKEIKVTLNQNAVEELWRQSPCPQSLHSSACALGWNDGTSNLLNKYLSSPDVKHCAQTWRRNC